MLKFFLKLFFILLALSGIGFGGVSYLMDTGSGVNGNTVGTYRAGDEVCLSFESYPDTMSQKTVAMVDERGNYVIIYTVDKSVKNFSFRLPSDIIPGKYRFIIISNETRFEYEVYIEEEPRSDAESPLWWHFGLFYLALGIWWITVLVIIKIIEWRYGIPWKMRKKLAGKSSSSKGCSCEEDDPSNRQTESDSGAR